MLTNMAAAAAVDYGALFGTVVDEAQTGVTSTLPLGVKIMAIMLAVTLGVKVIRKLAK